MAESGHPDRRGKRGGVYQTATPTGQTIKLIANRSGVIKIRTAAESRAADQFGLPTIKPQRKTTPEQTPAKPED